MAGLDIITNHPLLVAFILVGTFCIWKFIIQPIMNQGEPLDPTQDQVDGNIDVGLNDLN